MENELFRIRIASRFDIPMLSKLATETYADAFGHTMSAEDLQLHLEQHLSEAVWERALREDKVFVATIQDRLVGFVQLGAHRGDNSSSQPLEHEIRRVYIHSDFRNDGCGTALLRRAIAEAETSACSRTFIEVWEENVSARRLYERLGFSRVGSRRFVTPSGAELGFDVVLVRERRDRLDR